MPLCISANFELKSVVCCFILWIEMILLISEELKISQREELPDNLCIASKFRLCFHASLCTFRCAIRVQATLVLKIKSTSKEHY